MTFLSFGELNLSLKTFTHEPLQYNFITTQVNNNVPGFLWPPANPEIKQNSINTNVKCFWWILQKNHSLVCHPSQADPVRGQTQEEIKTQ